MKNLLLCTLSFPYDIGGEITFIKSELQFYLQHFNKVNILPSQKSHSKADIASRIEVDLSLINYTEEKKNYLFTSSRVFSFASLFCVEFAENRKLIAKYKGFKKLVSNYLLVCMYLEFFELYFQNKEENWIIYTYWFTPMTTAAVLYAAKHQNIKVVTRAHGIDLYEFRNNNYIPFRRKTIELLTNYFFVSETGKKYTEHLYPEYKSKYVVFSLGVEDLNIRSSKSEPEYLSIVSCSSVDTNKRIHLLIYALGKLAIQNPALTIKWNHFGSGPDINEIQKLAQMELTDIVKYHFHGFVANDAILNFYRHNNIDVFVTTSASEGKPMSIMEAFCCSIPVVATNVGGIPEIVDNENGILLSANPEVEEITESLHWFVDNSSLIESKKNAARVTWEKKCNATRNFSVFAKFIGNI